MDNLEHMAKEYNNSLTKLEASGSSAALEKSGILENIDRIRGEKSMSKVSSLSEINSDKQYLVMDAIDIIKTQLDLIDGIILTQTYPVGKTRKMFNYIKSIKFEVLRRLYSMAAVLSTVEYKERERFACPSIKLIDLQIDLFEILDKIFLAVDIMDIILLETRALALMA